MSDVPIKIDAVSPLWQYDPGGWTSDQAGKKICKRGQRCAVQLENLVFKEITLTWKPSGGSGQVAAGVDGRLSTGEAGAGSVSLPTQFGKHSARLQIEPSSGDIEFQGGTLTTQTSTPSKDQNLDDNAPEIIYTGWTSTSSSQTPIEAIRQGNFYQNTISYTSSASASATISNPGEIIQVFGCTGPSFGSFKVVINGQESGVFNTTNPINTYETLLWVGQIPSSQMSVQDKVEIVNQVDGRLLALDKFIISGSGSGQNPSISQTPTVSTSQTVSQPNPTGVNPPTNPGFPGAAQGGGGSSNTGAIIGGILGTLFGLLLLFMWWRYRQYRKAGGEGDFFAALCGPRLRPPQTPDPKKDDLKLWPMMRSRPKYST